LENTFDYLMQNCSDTCNNNAELKAIICSIEWWIGLDSGLRYCCSHVIGRPVSGPGCNDKRGLSAC
jgi:hypothetical protein